MLLLGRREEAEPLWYEWSTKPSVSLQIQRLSKNELRCVVRLPEI